jgi:hypothetical protein
VNDILPNLPDQPPRELRGDLAAQSRYAELIGVLGEPQDRAERNLLFLLARLLSTDEARRLLVMVRRAMRAARNE